MPRYDRQNRFVREPRVNVATNVDMVDHVFVADTIAALKGVPSDIRSEGDDAIVTANGSRWRFSAASVVVDASDNLVLSPTAGLGKWLRTDQSVNMKFAVAFGTADAAILHTVPVGFAIELSNLFWEVTTSWTGGTSSAIGVSSSAAPHVGKGDLLGGAAGSLLANLTTAIRITSDPRGLSYTATPFSAALVAADTIIFDRITSVFTAGAGFVHVTARQLVP